MTDHEESPRSAQGGTPAVIQKRGHRTACNSCKRMKVKCEWDQESICNRCLKHHTECVFTIPERKKREKKETYLTTLEDRLNRMEAVMAQSGLSLPPKDKKPTSTEEAIQDIPDQLSLLKIFDDGTTLFIGAASGFSIFGHQGLKWVTQVTGSDEFARLIMTIPSPRQHMTPIGPDTWARRPDDQHEPLPNREQALELINEFFNSFALIFPLFSKAMFMQRFEQKYPVTASQDPAWYACLNVAFTIGSVGVNKHKARESPNSSASSPRSQYPEEEDWWKWFRNAASTYVDLQFREGSMLAVQAMIGMAFILQTLPNPHPCSVLSGAALRLAQAIGLHRNVNDVALTPALIEERRNVFWTGVVIERAMLLRSGRPSVMQEDDIGIDLPKPEKGMMMGPNVPQPLRYMSTLSLLQGRIYNKLYSAKATTRSTLERLQWVSTLDEELQEWKDNLPIEIRPGNEMKVKQDFVIPVLMMHYGYFNALSTIHRCSVHYESWTNVGEPPLSAEAMSKMKLNPRVFASAAITLGAARSVIGLLRRTGEHVDGSEINIIRMLEYYPLSACLILFASVLQNPRDSQALSDVQLMKDTINFLASFIDLGDKSPTNVVIRTFKVVSDLAGRFVEKTQAESAQTSKRSREPFKPASQDYVQGIKPSDYLDESIRDHPPRVPALDTHTLASSHEQEIPPGSFSPPDQFRTSTSSNPTLVSNVSYKSNTTSTPLPSLHQNPQFSAHQQNQPNPTSPTQYLPSSPSFDIPLNPYLNPNQNDIYTSSLSPLIGLDSTLSGTNMDFFPNNVLMPTDGSWFFPVVGANTSFGGGLDGGGQGVSRENWVNTTGMGFGWSLGGGQNVDWGFGVGESVPLNPDQNQDRDPNLNLNQ